MSEHLEEHLDLCAGYALGSLDAPDRIRLEAHLADGCPACEAALAELRGSHVTYVTVHTGRYDAGTLKAIDAIGALDLVADEDGIRLYRLK